MSNRTKEVDIKNFTYYFFNKMINLGPNRINIDEKSCKNILIYHIGYVMVKDLNYIKINNVNPLYLIINNINGSIKDSNGSKYLTIVSTGESKDTPEKYEELRSN